MSNSPALLVEAASAVAALGSSQAEIDLLDDASLLAGMGLVRKLDQQEQTYKLWLAAAIAKRSDHTLGYDGLARRNGSATPALFIQSMTGSSIEEATRLARLGQSMVDAETPPAGEASASPEVSPVVDAALSGGISVDAADAIRRGLGEPDDVVTAQQLAALAEELIARAGVMTPEALLRAARRARTDLDLDAIDRGQKQRSMIRYVRVWKRDGMCGGSWAAPDEDGGLEIYNALKLMVAKQTNGPRFADATKETGAAPDITETQTPTGAVIEDERTPEHLMADGFVQVFHNGLTADPTIVPGSGRAPVRVIVPKTVLTDRVAAGPETPPTGSGILEDTLTAISFGKLEEYLCEGGTIAVFLNENGQLIDVGREQRLYTKTQRTGLGVRDGGCRFPDCDKPPSWCEAHHINYWARDTGPTDVANGILLCRYHHMLIHNTGWEIIHDTALPDAHDGYWLKPPKERDPDQTPIEMPTKNPLIAAMKHALAG
jgi:hypothetical protein